jgi:hypothetical protein
MEKMSLAKINNESASTPETPEKLGEVVEKLTNSVQLLGTLIAELGKGLNPQDILKKE